MKNLVRAAAIFSGVVGLSGVAAALVVGCGGDDTVIGYGNDSGPDAISSDTSTDSPGDSSPGDAGSDAPFHFDAGKPDLSAFARQINETGCAWIQNCCGASAAGFNATQCTADFADPATAGFLFTRPLTEVTDAGANITFDQGKASLCLSLIQGLSCGTTNTAVTSASLIAVRDACYGAIQGNIPLNGTGCTSSLECASPNHCEPQGGGTCVAPYAAGDTCAFAGDTTEKSFNRCGRADEGIPGYCQTGGFDTQLEAGTCATPAANGTACQGPYECSSWICDTTGIPGSCAPSEALITSDLCAAYAVDGG